MNKELKSKLVNALKGAGIDEGLADAMKDQSDEAVESFISSLKPKSPSIEDILASEAFEEYIAEGGFDKLLTVSKKAQSEFDRKTTKALNTFKQNLLGRKGDDEGGDDDLPSTEESGQSNELVKMIAKLNEKIDRLENARTIDSKKEQALGLLKKSTLPKSVHEKWLSRIDLNSDLSKQVVELETEFKDLIGESTGELRFDMNRKRDDGSKLSGSEMKALEEAAKKL